MAWYQTIIEDLDDHLGAAQRRFLSTILELADAGSDNQTIFAADKQQVISRLSDVEKRTPSEQSLRKRIELINAAEGVLRDVEADEDPLFRFQSRKTHYEIVFAPSLKDRLEQRKAREQAVESTLRDTDIDVDDYEEPRVENEQPHFQIFISHAHEHEDVEVIVKDFAGRLKAKLSHLPHKYKSKFSLGLWIDHLDKRGREPFQGQTDAECKESDLAIFLLSDRWYNSAACKREAGFFHDPEKPARSRYLRIQLSGKWKQGDPAYTDGPVFPEAWRSDVKTLLDFERLPEAGKDEFVTRIRDEICGDIGRRHFPDDSQPSTGPKKKDRSIHKPRWKAAGLADVSKSALRHELLDREVREDLTEEPQVSSVEGGETAEGAIPMLMDWACSGNSPNRIFAMLGSFGAGKTITSQLFARELDRKRAGDAKTPYPVYLDFRRLIDIYERDTRTPPTLAEIIRQCLHSDVRDTIDTKQLLTSLRTEPCVIIFDGLDEIGTRVGQERAASLYRNLLEIVPMDAWKADRARNASDWSACPTRVLVTCRTHFFRDHVEQKSVLCEHDRFSGLQTRDSHEPVRTVYMAPFDLEQIQSFFCKVLGDEAGSAAFGSISRVHDLAGLAKKPIMARYIAELAPDLVRDSQEGRVINVASVYGHLFRRALERDQDKRLLLAPSDRQALLENLAQHLWLCRSPSLSVDNLGEWFDGYAIDNPGLRLTVSSGHGARGLLHTELRNASLLVRENDDAFRFVHTSFFEYFLARRVLKLLMADALSSLPELPNISRETLDFIPDLVAIDDCREDFCQACDKIIMPGNSKALRKLALEIRLALSRANRGYRVPGGADLSDLDLRDTDFDDVGTGEPQILSVSFARSNLLRCRFRDITFEACDFSGANLSNALFDECRFVKCRGAPSHTGSARMHAVAFDATSEKEISAHLPLQFAMQGEQSLFNNLPKSVKARLSIGANAVSAVFSPDGKTILTASLDTTARLWDVNTAAEIRQFSGHDGMVLSAVFSPDGKTILTASNDNTARLWDVKTAAEIRQFSGHDSRVQSAVFSPDGKTILTASSDGTARLWDVKTAAEIRQFSGHDSRVQSAVFSPDGKTILTASWDNTARLWDVKTAAEIRKFSGHDGMVLSAVFSPDGKTILTASNDNTARLWDVKTAAEIRQFSGHDNVVESAVFSPDGKTILTASWDNTARLWDVKTAAEIRQFSGHDSRVESAVFSPDGKTILTASYDNTARLWDVKTAAEIRQFSGHDTRVQSAVFSPDGKTILTASDDSTARLWDVKTAAEIRQFSGHDTRVQSAVFSPDGKTILTASSDGTARLWDVKTAAEIRQFSGHDSKVQSAVFSPDGKTILTASWDNTARLWDVNTAAEIRQFSGHDGMVLSAVFSPDGKTILTASNDNTARLWDVKTAAEIRQFSGHDNVVESAVFSPDGKTILTASWDNTARLWDVKTAAEIRQFSGHDSRVQSAVFSPDGKTILTASNDNTARLWDVKTAAEIRQFSGHDSRVQSAVFSPDGHKIVNVSNHSIVTIIDVATGDNEQSRVALPDGWVLLDDDRNVLKAGSNVWKYVHGVKTNADGTWQVVSPFPV